jgi:hypothetical protein
MVKVYGKNGRIWKINGKSTGKSIEHQNPNNIYSIVSCWWRFSHIWWDFPFPTHMNHKEISVDSSINMYVILPSGYLT